MKVVREGGSREGEDFWSFGKVSTENSLEEALGSSLYREKSGRGRDR